MSKRRYLAREVSTWKTRRWFRPLLWLLDPSTAKIELTLLWFLHNKSSSGFSGSSICYCSNPLKSRVSVYWLYVCIFTYVYVYSCIFTAVLQCIGALVVNTQNQMPVLALFSAEVYVRIHLYIQICADTYIYISKYICVNICTSAYISKYTYIQLCAVNPTWGDIFESSKLKDRMSLLPRFSEKRRSSFELWALKQHSKMSPQVGLAVHRHDLLFNFIDPQTRVLNYFWK